MEHSDDRSDQWSSDEIAAMQAKNSPPLTFNSLTVEQMDNIYPHGWCRNCRRELRATVGINGKQRCSRCFAPISNV